MATFLEPIDDLPKFYLRVDDKDVVYRGLWECEVKGVKKWTLAFLQQDEPIVFVTSVVSLILLAVPLALFRMMMENGKNMDWTN